MGAIMKHKVRVAMLAMAAIGTSLLAPERIGTPIVSVVIGLANAQDAGGGGGHDSGGSSGGHDSGGGASGHNGGGSGRGGGGHDAGGETGGTVEKGHGTRYGHEGHESGQHQGATSHPSPGAERFGGGSGIRGNGQVPEGVGRYGSGAARLEDVGRTRLRYWGGWSNPDDPLTPPDPGTETTTPTTGDTADFIPGPGGGPAVNVRNSLDSSPRCQGVSLGMTAAQQFSGSNLLRLNTARGEVDPALAASGKIAAPYLMGNLQNELIKPAPNPELAGTLLGLVAKAPVTAGAVMKIGFLLCARMNDTQADQIAQIAEQQRMALAATPAPRK
ncbi:hypothetical protein PCE31106_03792 [Pandoraea cepalis]|uniref:Uncharacterized protein n=1 Tax=Pandoraea cepalis TaxID=2508294 RepID=A0A5E4XC73_9BURK|nr:hypothetical protein [Pandoraea cepalis]VVE34019.1 hypothetical protein PCE31106_03792 [Pandoraea cepalis]